MKNTALFILIPIENLKAKAIYHSKGEFIIHAHYGLLIWAKLVIDDDRTP